MGSGGSHYTCFAKTTSAPVTLDPTSSPNTPQYQYSQLGSNSCPSGCSAINDLQTCKNILSAAQSMNPAASQLGGNTAGSGSRRNSWRRLQDLLVLEQGQCRVSVISGPRPDLVTATRALSSAVVKRCEEVLKYQN